MPAGTCTSIRDRATFARLRRPTGQARSGPVRARHLDAPAAGPTRIEVAYAIGRSYGTAVQRNRARRRLRAALHELSPTLPSGSYLLTADRSLDDLDFPHVVGAVRGAMTSAAGITGRVAAGGARRATVGMSGGPR
jgi:ribonuclease P protein component